MDEAPIVLARVLLRSAEGKRPGIDVPITAGTLGRLTPPPETVTAVADHFARAGFVLLGRPGITIGISGPRDLFERHFGIELTLGADHAYTVGQAHRSGRERATPDGPADPTNIPEDHLPPAIRRAISQIALETSVSTDQKGFDP
jgi:hypothetical protein